MTDPAEPLRNGDRWTTIHVRKAIDNDRASVGWLVARFTPVLLCQARQRMAPSLRRFVDPEDVVADVWMVVLGALPELQPSQGSASRGLIRFASTVMIRRLRDLLEKHVVGKPVTGSLEALPTGALAADTRGVVSHVVAAERQGRVWSGLEELPAQDREILVLRGIEGRPHSQIAALVGLTPENVAVRYHRALKRLRTLLPDSVFDDLVDE
jgi:RNA polymerase sigma factor (sigma-70 family)